MHLSAINQVEGPKPWKPTGFLRRALQDEALKAWRGRQESVAAVARAFYHRAKCNSAAAPSAVHDRHGNRVGRRVNSLRRRRALKHNKAEGENYRGKAAIERTGRHHR